MRQTWINIVFYLLYLSIYLSCLNQFSAFNDKMSGYIAGLFSCLCKIIKKSKVLISKYSQRIFIACSVVRWLILIETLNWNWKRQLVLRSLRLLNELSLNYVVSELCCQTWFRCSSSGPTVMISNCASASINCATLTSPCLCELAVHSCSEVFCSNIDWAYAYRTGPKMLEDIKAWRHIKPSTTAT